MFSPTLNIDGLWSGYTGPGSKTLLPHRMTVKMDIRLVPEMQVEKTSLVREHLDKHGFSEIKIRRLEEGYGWTRMSVNSPYSKAMLKALGEFKVEVEVWPTIAGSTPFSMFAAPPLKLPFIVGGMGHGGPAHSPNEYLVISERGPTGGLMTMEKSFAAILDHVSTIRKQ
ncbi:MAG: peptidase dimerization domain-containing protein [Thaumarchaeota archaeon]|nr:peptidase dimerization domain-containing protein [Nitrososphaerota archaeon]